MQQLQEQNLFLDLKLWKKFSNKKKTTRPVFVVRHDPRLPSVTKIVHKHYRSMVQDPYLAEVVPDPPLVAYTRPINIRDKLIRAKLPSKTRPKRRIPGMKRCNKNWKICPYVNQCKVVKATYSDKVVQISREYNCQTANLVYLVHCLKCKNQYVGETGQTLCRRFGQHLGYVDNKDFKQATGRHFNLPGHCKSHMSITVLESIKSNDEAYRKRRESHYIEQFNLKYKGMNKKRWHIANCNEIFFIHLGTETYYLNFNFNCYDYCQMRTYPKSRKYSQYWV